MFFIKNKVLLSISLISVSLIVLGTHFFRWQQLDESLTKNRALNEVVVSPLFWAWPEAAEDPLLNSFGEFFVTETHWGYGDPVIPLTIDSEQVEKLQKLLQSVRVRPSKKMLSPSNPPAPPIGITFLFINQEYENTSIPDHVQISFFGSRFLEVNKRSHQNEDKEASFEIHQGDEMIFYDVLTLLNSEALELFADTRY